MKKSALNQKNHRNQKNACPKKLPAWLVSFCMEDERALAFTQKVADLGYPKATAWLIIGGRFRFIQEERERLQKRNRECYSPARNCQIKTLTPDTVLPPVEKIDLAYAEKAIESWRRHTETDYDELLDKNHGRGSFEQNRSEMKPVSRTAATERKLNFYGIHPQRLSAGMC